MTAVLQHLPFEGYDSKPWKNGRGITHDIALIPPNAGHDNFDLRFALSPITEDGVFSAFPGIERVITLIEGAGLALEFADRQERLEPDASLQFDSALTPFGRPQGGTVMVINVMARRGLWQIARCTVITDGQDYRCAADGMFFVFCIDEGWRIETGAEAVTPARYDSVLVRGSTPVKLQHQGGGRAIVAEISAQPG